MGRPEEVPTGERPVDKIRIKCMKNHHRSMARDFVVGGLRNKELARMYSFSPSQVSIIINSPAFIAECSRLESDLEEEGVSVKEEIRLIAPLARRVLAKDLASDLEDLEYHLPARKYRAGVAQDILDRAGVHKGGDSGGGDLHIHKHEEIHIHKMSDEELRDDVFDLLGEGE